LPENKIYAGKTLTKFEKERVELVKKLYDYEITLPQIAWFRKKFYEEYYENETIALQEHPWTEYDAFQVSGLKYLPVNKLSEILQTEMKSQKQNPPAHYQVDVYEDLIDIQPVKGTKANFVVWEHPQPNQKYAIGADPTFGANPDSDWGVISIWKVDENTRGIVQVAEFADRLIDPVRFARLLALLCSLYYPSYLNLEITGPGQIVLKEMQNLYTTKYKTQIYLNIPKELNLFQSDIKYPFFEYLYYRADTLRPSFSKHTSYNSSYEHISMWEAVRSLINNNQFFPKSITLIQQLIALEKIGNTIQASGMQNDDHAVASALASILFKTYIQPYLKPKTTFPKSKEDLYSKLITQ